MSLLALRNKIMINTKNLILIVTLSVAALSPTIQAKDLTAQLDTCSKVVADKARLKCFDQIVFTKELPAVIGKTQDQQSSTFTATQVDSFSKEQVTKTAEEKAKEIDSIVLTISKLKKVGRGQWKITFSNGQQWLQKDTTKLKLKVDEEVTLSKGALSSVFLQKENTNKRMKVKRLK